MAVAQRITLEENDNGYKFIFTIKKDNVIEPLTGAKVLFKMKEKTTGYEMDRYCTITDENNAECQYVFTFEDLSHPGAYTTELETTYSNGTVLSAHHPLVVIIRKEDYNKTDRN